MDRLSTRELFACAEFELENDRATQALILLKRLEVATEQPETFAACLGRVYAKLRLFDLAKASFENFLLHHSQAVVERFQLSMVLSDMGNPDLADQICDEILEIEPGFTPALFQKGSRCLDKDDEHSAQIIFNQICVSSEPSNLYHRLSTQALSAMETPRIEVESELQ